MACIYALVHPDTGMVRYIGKANDPGKRLETHIRDSRRLRRPVNCWIRSLGRPPEIVVLAEDCQDWKAVERRLIASARDAGYPLLNLADGGDQPSCPPEVLRANGKATLARFRSGEYTKAERGLSFEQKKIRMLQRHFEWSSRLGEILADKAWMERAIQKSKELKL